jgi:hypothetical protein
LRHQSKKAAARARAAKPIRTALIQKANGLCEVCRKPRELACHEIANGQYYRQAALAKPYALLVVCNECNGALCDKAKWPTSRQLALLKLRRPDDFDLEKFNLLVNFGPKRTEHEQVDRWISGHLIPSGDRWLSGQFLIPSGRFCRCHDCGTDTASIKRADGEFCERCGGER